MNVCYFEYILKQGERIVSTFNGHLKMMSSFQIFDKKGLLVATNSRLLFCQVIGDHPHLLHTFEYKYITSLKFKEDEMYLYAKYNGDSIKINELQKDEIENIKIVIDTISC